MRLLWKPFYPRNSVIYVTICKRKEQANFILIGLKLRNIMKTKIKFCELQSYINCIIQNSKVTVFQKTYSILFLIKF